MRDSQTNACGKPVARPVLLQHSAFSIQRSASRPAFTLTELLIVIAIIAVLAALATAAAVNALRAANRGRITMTIQGVSRAAEEFKTDFGAYPPNAMHNGDVNSVPAQLAKRDFLRMFSQAFPRHNEPQSLILGLCGHNTSGSATENLDKGMRAGEAIYFWLGGFSDDPQYPISGPGGPAFIDTGNIGDEVLENRNRKYEFDLSLLGPRRPNGTFNDDSGAGRFITYVLPSEPSVRRRINFWRYMPKNSTQPLVYFDVSRHKPRDYDMWAAEPGASGDPPWIVAVKKLRSGVPAVNNNIDNVVFVNEGKFQILHAGLDDSWGATGNEFKQLHRSELANIILYPDGPFIGEIADTLTNFSDGTLADAAE